MADSYYDSPIAIGDKKSLQTWNRISATFPGVENASKRIRLYTYLFESFGGSIGIRYKTRTATEEEWNLIIMMSQLEVL